MTTISETAISSLKAKFSDVTPAWTVTFEHWTNNESSTQSEAALLLAERIQSYHAQATLIWRIWSPITLGKLVSCSFFCL